MKVKPLKRKTKSMKHNGYFLHNDHLFDQDSGLYLEEYFNEMLCMERKRTERSKKPFLLMLLDIEKILPNDRKNEIVRKILPILFSSTRETDIKGWFKNNHIIGAIFTEINGTDKNSIKQKVINNLCSILDVEQVNKIEITCYLFPEEWDKQKPGSLPDLNFYQDLLKRNSSKKNSLLMKRVMDILGSVMALIILSPFFIVIPFLIKLSSKGPILFKQERIGHFGKKFTFLKFRSMYIDNDQKIHQEYIKKLITEQKNYVNENGDGNNSRKCVYKINDDPRVTPIGRFLRKTSLDEFPQFINVLKGEMSLAGPRPPIPYELENYDIWHRRRLLEAKPGITGLWQVKGRSRTTFDEMVRLDLQYVRDWSLWLDIKILSQTPWVVLNGKGAY